jgi:hypothetical protein
LSIYLFTFTAPEQYLHNPLDASVLEDPASGRPMVVPIGTRHVLAPYDK